MFDPPMVIESHASWFGLDSFPNRKRIKVALSRLFKIAHTQMQSVGNAPNLEVALSPTALTLFT
jgi:hypothetical protein